MNELPTLKPGMEIRLESGENITGLHEPIEVQVTETASVSTSECKLVTLSIPVLEPCVVRSFQDESHRVDLKNMTRERMRKLRALRRGMIASGATLENGSDIRTNADAIYCLLDLIEI